MTIDAWLQAAAADAEKRGLSELKSLLDGLAQSTRALRGADFNDDARGAANRRPLRGADVSDDARGAADRRP